MSKWQKPFPAKPQLALVYGDQGHDPARIGPEIIGPVAAFRRDDEPEMMPVPGPRPYLKRLQRPPFSRSKHTAVPVLLGSGHAQSPLEPAAEVGLDRIVW